MDWHTWHDDYDRPDSVLARRLRAVQERIRLALDACPPGPLLTVSMCAGQGRDLLGVLPEHPRREDVTARLVELDPRNAALAEQAADRAGLQRVEVVVGDASLTSHYAGMVPADLVLVCGVFGNITDEDVERTITYCRQLCKQGGTLVWTRHRKVPDLAPQICHWLEERDFERQWLSEPDAGFGVGAHRFNGEPQPLSPGASMFTFVGYDALARGDGHQSRS
ncbi:class I SAM-dependent methyltransferase [Actinacidiphila oryziradicis]|uniref:Class I SAM-dependent methyltransferase n=1 Tax=Actinacidiphila oryziradicis TaxID=2571141 RepID=A0A4U0SQC6_9ACTN|nr:class I SAM-dependent methyltransferase [Actinacidiphila oryziradicis]TKA11403.1 class I SAM-dependent methyltransferase [Actinacidiphila oryziradicis]